MLPRRLLSGVLAAWLLAVGIAAGDQSQLSRQDADSLLAKLTTINRHAIASARRPAAERATSVSERELNAYLRFHAASEFPAGVIEPYVWMLGEGRVAGRALVDLDAVRERRPRGWTDPAGYLAGRVPVQAVGTLRTENGVGRFQLESAEVGGIAVPTAVLQEIVSYYTRTPQTPAGISLEAPFQLPAAIREVRLAKGTAVVVQ